MTCIVGIVDRESGRVFIGADSGGVSGWDLVIRSDPKVFEVGPFVIGFTTSFRMGQLIRFRFEPPIRPDDMALDRYMATLFIDAVRDCLKEGGFAKIDNGQESGGAFLVGHAGHLFEIGSDFSVGESTCGYAAVGSGEAAAHGALHAIGSLRANADLIPATRVVMALSAAEAHNIGVNGPFTVLVTDTAP